MNNGVKLAPRQLVFDERIHNGDRYPPSCYRLGGVIHWAKVLQWLCPSLSDDEAALCVSAGARAGIRTYVGDIKWIIHQTVNVAPIAEPDDDPVLARVRSAARVRAMELGLSPWPSASGWAPMDLPWKERRILIGIVEGVASLARWAHDIWLRDHQPFADCCDCGDPVCSESCPP